MTAIRISVPTQAASATIETTFTSSFHFISLHFSPSSVLGTYHRLRQSSQGNRLLLSRLVSSFLANFSLPAVHLALFSFLSFPFSFRFFFFFPRRRIYNSLPPYGLSIGLFYLRHGGQQSSSEAGMSDRPWIGACAQRSNSGVSQLTREYKAISENPPPYIQAHPSDSNILEYVSRLVLVFLFFDIHD